MVYPYGRILYGVSQVALVVKNQPVNSGDVRDTVSIPLSGRFPGGGHGNPLQNIYEEFMKLCVYMHDVIFREKAVVRVSHTLGFKFCVKGDRNTGWNTFNEFSILPIILCKLWDLHSPTRYQTLGRGSEISES